MKMQYIPLYPIGYKAIGYKGIQGYSYINVQYLLIQIQEYSVKQYASAFGSILDLHTTILKKELAESDKGDKGDKDDKGDKGDNRKVQCAGLDTNISDKMKNIITSMDNFN